MRVDELKKSYEKFGELYPVLTDKNGEIIDGFHRKKVNPKWREFKTNAKTEIEKAILGLVANIIRREISREEIAKRLGKIAELTGWKPKRIAIEVGMTHRWVNKYIPQRYKEQFMVKRTKKRKKSSIGNEGVERRSTENNSNDTMTTEEKERMEDFYLQNVWFDTKERENYGDSNFHGNTAPTIIKQCLLKYTKEKNIVLDAMAGSGTIIDICKEMNRKCLAFDIKPLREDIKFADAEQLKINNNSIDFVFAHFPYWNMVKYSREKEDLSNKNLKEFLEKSEKILKEFYRILRANKYCVVLIGDKRHGGNLIDLSAHLGIIGLKIFNHFDKVIFVNKSQRSLGRIDSNLTKWRAQKHGYHIQTFDTLLIFKK